jgi:hypothetical protein
MGQRLFFIPMPVWVPGVLSLLALGGAYFSLWFLLALPFVWLGAICSAPNFNLADGCLAVVAMAVGFVVAFFWPPGFIISVSTFVSWFLCAFERGVRARPVDSE